MNPHLGQSISPKTATYSLTSGYNEALKKLGRFNLAILGDTGVGKSSLVNAIFGDTRAATGIGAPITKEAELYINEPGTFGVWDFEGFEHGTTKSPLKTLQERIKDIQGGNKHDRIHIAWFCWDASAGRVTEGHRELIKLLSGARIPTIGVLTKAHTRQGILHPDQVTFARWIEEQDLGFAVPETYPTAAIDDPWGYPQFGLHELLETTVSLAPETVADAARSAQVIDLRMKAGIARKIIATASTSAGGIAVAPIPVASAVALAPIQLVMFGKICGIYGLSLKSVLGGGSMVFQLTLQLTGRAAAESLVKLIPGAGPVINATVASAWTAAAGETWRKLCEGIATGKIDPNKIEDIWQQQGPAIRELFIQLITTPPKWLKT